MIERRFADISTKAANYEALDIAWVAGRASGWTDLLKSRRIMVYAEAGAGKTHECISRAKILWDAGEPAFFLELADLARQGGRDLLSGPERQRLDEWRQRDEGIATFFLDSFDELKLSRGSFRKALLELERLVEGRLARARIVVTTRPIPFDAETFRQLLPIPEEQVDPNPEQFARIAAGVQETKKSAPPDWRAVKLLPFTDNQVLEFAKLRNIQDTDRFFADIQRRGLQEFSRRPLDLEELCAAWLSGATSNTQRADIAANVLLKLQPHRSEAAELSVDRAIEGAGRLAIAVALTRKRSIRYVPNDDASAAALALDPRLILTDWAPAEQTTLLQRAMFSFASYGAVRFHHRSVQEYLAAERMGVLLRAGMSMKAAKRLLFGTTAHRELIVKPSMRSVAAWLAGVQPAIFDEVVKREPVILLTHGDPSSLSLAERARALEATLAQHGSGGWRGLEFPQLQARRFVSPELAPTIEKAWRKGVENPELRDLLLALVEYGHLVDCADIAYEAASNASGRELERLNAVDALIALDDRRLNAIAGSITAREPSWPVPLARWVALRIFPKFLDAAALCSTLPRLASASGCENDSWERQLADALAGLHLTPQQLDSWRITIKGLLEIDPDPEKCWPGFEAKKSSLVSTFALVCRELIDRGSPSDDALQDACLALRLRHDFHADDTRSELRDRLDALSSSVRLRLFAADDALMRRMVPSRTLIERVRDVNHGPVRLKRADSEWLLEVVRDPAADASIRSLAACMSLVFWEPPADRKVFADLLTPHITDLPDAAQYVSQWAEMKPDEALVRMMREHDAIEEQRKVREANRLRDWETFWSEVATQPDVAFGGERLNATVTNLWNAMNKTGASITGSEWKRAFIASHFSADTADRLRQALMKLWRAETPELPCERPVGKANEYPQRWLVGLAGIAAESEDPHWSKNLTEVEAAVASRLVPWHLNGFPPWLERLAQDKPTQVSAVLGKQLTYELEQPATDNWHSAMLQSIRHGSPAIAALFLPALLGWLEAKVTEGISDPMHRLELHRIGQVVGILQTHGDLSIQSRVVDIAKSRLDTDGNELTAVWMRALMGSKPEVAVTELERRLQGAAGDQGVYWIATLFGEGAWHTGGERRDKNLPADVLVRLVRLAQKHVRVEDDVVHTGAYTPGTREHAERGRDALLSRLLNVTGPEGWKAKLELAKDPLLEHVRARILAVALERAAEDADAVAVSEADLRGLTRATEMPPATSSDMHMLLQDRLDDIEDMLLRDHSPREAWAAMALEHLMRREFARELDTNRRGAYTVDQEAVTADEKETDIRLRSPLGPQGVIELKVAEQGWSAATLRSTISDQLVGRYMAAEACRSGCLLITLASDRTWNRPEGGTRMDPKELLSFLKAEARRIEETVQGEIRVDVRILDLRPRLKA
ncbi:ATP-binding protein [uncultured Pseudacidovorax sp.]|uniref:NACHT domain-containing protein n=1 Tax=uncultured Pseudacidovorax sp. TaxID=679313 RepID=UPI0025FEE0AB|nr:ATP-binding protein [uncultured Pseudacidovorax sp.]